MRVLNTTLRYARLYDGTGDVVGKTVSSSGFGSEDGGSLAGKLASIV